LRTIACDVCYDIHAVNDFADTFQLVHAVLRVLQLVMHDLFHEEKTYRE
jgi:hypothetical protein